MPDNKHQLRQDVMTAMRHEVCDQGPTLNRIVDHLERLDDHAKDTKEFQKEMVRVMRTQSSQTEKLVAIADKTQRNREDIDNLYGLFRGTEKDLTNHILTDSHTPMGKSDSFSKAKKWDMLDMAMRTGAILGGGAFIWQLFERSVIP